MTLFGDRLIAVHLHDNDGTSDQHLVPFTAKIDWTQQMSAIAATGYSGPTMLECKTGRPESTTGGELTAEQWLNKAYNAAKNLDALRK